MVCITGKACEEHTACEGKACEEWVFTSCCWFGETIFAAALTYQTAWRWFVLQAKPAKNIPLAKAKPSKSGAHKKLNLCRFDWSFHPPAL